MQAMLSQLHAATSASSPSAFTTLVSRAPLVPPGFAHPPVQALTGQLQVLRDGLEAMHTEVRWLKRETKRQGCTMNWLKLDPVDYEATKTAVKTLEAAVVELIDHAEGQDRKIEKLEDQVGNVEEDNRELRKEVTGLKEELGQLRSLVKKICFGASVVGGVVLVGGAVAWFRKN